jgi:alpha-glucosidase (family GH31 glycosyl hydrolase)
MTPTASNVLFGWWSHDIGGNHNGGTTSYENHTAGKPGPYPGDELPSNKTGAEMLLRWIQFGVVSPILRTHCEPTCDRYVCVCVCVCVCNSTLEISVLPMVY